MRSGRFALYREMARAALQGLGSRRLSSSLAAASMAAAVAAVVLVATVAATGSDFVVGQIEGVGSNLVYAYYEAGGNVSVAEADYINLSDVEAVRGRLGTLATAVAPVTSSWTFLQGGGQPVQVRVLGTGAEYRRVRNLQLHAGRFLDGHDVASRAKVCMVTPHLARRLYGAPGRAVGQRLAVHGLFFRVVGEFSESVETFGQSEVSDYSVVVPYTVHRYFLRAERVDPLYVSVRSQREVEEAAGLVRETLESRHRPGSSYRVDTLSGVLATARRVLSAMSLVLTLVASVTLGVSGVFIMNLMLIAVSERTAEIGIRKAVGATNREIRLQFLFEALLLVLSGALVGAALGIGLPWAVSLAWPGLGVSLPLGWALLAVLVAGATGTVFGLIPAVRAARLDPVEALRHD